MNNKLEITTLCYVEQNGQYLMLHRNKKQNDINKDKYIGIGGHMEHGESPKECVTREAFEETGLELDEPKLRGILTFVIDDMTELCFLYTCEKYSGELHSCDEGDLVWIEKDKVLDLPLWEGDKIFLKLLETEEKLFQMKLIYKKGKLLDYKIQEA